MLDITRLATCASKEPSFPYHQPDLKIVQYTKLQSSTILREKLLKTMRTSTKRAIIILFALLSPTLAADCFTVTGVNTQQLGQTGLADAIDSTCADLRSGLPHTSSTSGDTLFSVRATSTAATYEFCEAALENIAAQCANDVLGKFDFEFNGNTEHYEVQGHADNPGDKCTIHKGGVAPPENEEDSCL